MKLFTKISYRHKVAGVIFLFILLPFFASSLLIAKNSWDNKVESILQQNRSELKIGVEAVNALYLSNLQKLTFINNNNVIITYLKEENFSDLINNMKVYDGIKKIVDALIIDSPDIEFTIYPLNDEVYNGNYIEKLERLEKRLGKDGDGFMQQMLSLDWDKTLWKYERIENAKDPQEGMGYIRSYKKMKYLGKNLAITQMGIRISKLVKFIEGSFPEGSYLVFVPDDNTSTIILQKEQAKSDTGEWRVVSAAMQPPWEKYYLIEMELGYSLGKFAVYIPKVHILTELQGFLLKAFLVFILSIVALFLIVELASYLITRRLSRLIDWMNVNIENISSWSNLDRHSVNDDLSKMERKIYDMVEKIREAYRSNLEHEHEKKTFELELLQSRINPHFLYNTLSTMKWNCDNPNMAGIIDSMATYYRLALNKGDMIVLVSHEMKLMEEYLKIQKYTYESDFDYLFDIEEEVMDFPIIRNLLQPVVENAVMHGINGLDSGGRIMLSGKRTEDTIMLTIEDNGVGMPEEKVQQLLNGEHKSKFGGYGIKNVQKRIRLFYGSDSALQIISAPGKGTTAVITIPAVFADSNNYA